MDHEDQIIDSFMDGEEEGTGDEFGADVDTDETEEVDTEL